MNEEQVLAEKRMDKIQKTIEELNNVGIEYDALFYVTMADLREYFNMGGKNCILGCHHLKDVLGKY